MSKFIKIAVDKGKSIFGVISYLPKYQATPLFFWAILPILYSTNFYFWDIRITAFDFLFPFFLFTLLRKKDFYFSFKEYNFIWISIITIIIHSIFIFLFKNEVNYYGLIKDTLKIIYFCVLIGYGIYTFKTLSFSLLTKTYYFGYISILYGIIYCYISWDILNISVAFRTVEGAFICVYLFLISFFLLEGNLPKKVFVKNFLFILFTFIAISFWAMTGYQVLIGIITICIYISLLQKKYFKVTYSSLIIITVLLSILLEFFYIKQEFEEERKFDHYSKMLNIFSDGGFKERWFITETTMKHSLNNKLFIGSGAGQIDDILILDLNNKKIAIPFLDRYTYASNMQLHNSFLTLWVSFGFLSFFFFFFLAQLVFRLHKTLPFFSFIPAISILLAIMCLHDVFFMHPIIFYISFLYVLSTKGFKKEV